MLDIPEGDLEHPLDVALQELPGPKTLLLVNLENSSPWEDWLGPDNQLSLLDQVMEHFQELRPTPLAVTRQEKTLGVVLPGEVAEAGDQVLQMIGSFRCKLALHVPLRWHPCVGQAYFPRHGATLKDLYASASMALHEAQRSPRPISVLFDDQLWQDSKSRLSIEHCLSSAASHNELDVEYQPIVSIPSGQVVALEALLRWRHPLLGRLGPNRFIALAEQSGDIESLGQFVTEKALQDLNSWEGKGPVPLRMHINISAAQLFASSSTENLKRALGCLPSPGGMVELEITETTLLSPESVETKNLLNLIKGKVHLCLDDFGTGYSALGYLTYLPFSTLKLDKSFVDNLEDPRTGPIVNWIISLAHTLGARVVAEGIETPEQFGWLADHNCDEAQGFLFSRSLSKEGVDFLLTRERRKEKLWSPR